MKKKDIKPRNNKNQPHGYWETYWSNGELWYKGNFKDGKKDGYWEFYHDNGELACKGYYKDGKQDGYWEWYYDNGELREIEYCIN